MKIKEINTQSKLLIMILVVAAIVRFYRIDQPFVDLNGWREASTAMMAENLFQNWNIFYPEINWDGPGPSYNGREFQLVTLLAALLYNVFGQEDWIGRFVGVMFGVWGVFALYKLICCVWDQKRALVGSALMAVLPGSLFVDRSFLPDPGMVALATTGCWLLITYLQADSLKYLLLATLIISLAFLTKLIGLVIALPLIYAIFTILIVKQKPIFKQIITLTIAATVAVIPVILYYLWAKHLALTYPPYHFAGEQGFIWYKNSLQEWLNQKYYLPMLSQIVKDIWTTLGLVLIIIGLFIQPPNNTDNTNAGSEKSLEYSSVQIPWLFHWWLIGGGGLYYVIGANHLVGQIYNLHLFDPPAAAIAGHTIISALSLIQKQFKQRVIWNRFFSWIIVTMVFLVIVRQGGRVLQKYYDFYPDNNAYKMGLSLRQFSLPNDLVIAIGPDFGNPIPIYYSRRNGWVFPPANVWDEVSEDWWEKIPDDDKAIEIFEDLRTKGANWFGIVNSIKVKIWEDNPKFARYIEQTYELSQANSEFVIYRIPEKT